MKSLGLALVVVLSCSGAVFAVQQQVFKSRADVVTVDVAVANGNTPIASLVAADFELRDNGVVQAIDDVSFGGVPIDVRLVVDLSGSISVDQLRRHEAAMQEVQHELAPEDRCAISTFARRIGASTGLQPPPVAMNFVRPALDGTAFYDASLLAMMTAAVPGRRQMTILLTDGVDSSSFFDGADMIDAAKRTDSVVNIVSALDQSPTAAFAARMTKLIEPTGGRYLTIRKAADIGSTLTQLIGDFRKSYVLRYTPANVAVGGWHTISVSVPGRKSSNIRARQGYFGG